MSRQIYYCYNGRDGSQKRISAGAALPGARRSHPVAIVELNGRAGNLCLLLCGCTEDHPAQDFSPSGLSAQGRHRLRPSGRQVDPLPAHDAQRPSCSQSPAYHTGRSRPRQRDAERKQIVAQEEDDKEAEKQEMMEDLSVPEGKRTGQMKNRKAVKSRMTSRIKSAKKGMKQKVLDRSIIKAEAGGGMGVAQ